MDPKEQFVVGVITRSGIASDLNSYLLDEGVEGKLTSDDPRLTFEICTEYAEDFGNTDCDDEELYELQHKYCVKLGLISE